MSAKEIAAHWFEKLAQAAKGAGLTPEEIARIDAAPTRLGSSGYDDWGFDPHTFKQTLSIAKLLYREYFQTIAYNIERVPQGRVLIIANHSGQLPVDGALLIAALALEANPARVARGMVERWFPSIPFVGTFFMRCGLMVGDHRNCRELLERDECVVAFPEGIRGSGKPYAKRYELQRFGTGFVRLALETRTPIVPVGIVGCEEIYPAIFDFKPLARLLKVPYFPVTPTFPLLGPLGAVPLPSRVSLRFGEPLVFDNHPDAPDTEIDGLVERTRESIRSLIAEGLSERRPDPFFGARGGGSR